MQATELKRIIEVRDALVVENNKLVEENAKMTKRKAKLECKLKSALKDSKTILNELKLAVQHYEKGGSLLKSKFKKFKQIIKNHSK